MSLEDIKRKRNEGEKVRDAELEKTKKELKDRNAKKIQAKKQDNKKAPKAAAQAKAPAVKNVPKQKQAKGSKR